MKHSFWVLTINLIILAVISRLVLNHYVSFDELISMAGNFYKDYGPLLLFISGLLEAIIVIGWYYPGSTIILLGASLAGAGVISPYSVLLWGLAGLILGYIINYFIGAKWQNFAQKFELTEYVKKIKQRVRKNNLIYFWVTFHPDVAAVAALAFGMFNTNFWKFFFGITIASLFWAIFWGMLFYFFGMFLLERLFLLVAILIGGFILYEIFKIFHNRKRG